MSTNPTLAQLDAQIEELKKQAATLRAQAKAEVVADVLGTIELYQLQYEDLFGKVKRTRGPNKRAAAIYRDDAGNQWLGRGPKPLWLRNHVEAGRDIEEFLVAK